MTYDLEKILPHKRPMILIDDIKEINMDLITGLPGETTGDFAYTLDKVLSMSPENITVHTLAVKRASRLAEKDKNYHYHHADEAGEMMEYAYERLGAEGYIPYYLYRQKAACKNRQPL